MMLSLKSQSMIESDSEDIIICVICGQDTGGQYVNLSFNITGEGVCFVGKATEFRYTIAQMPLIVNGVERLTPTCLRCARDVTKYGITIRAREAHE